LIDERHEIDQLLGRGGMAEVFRATDTTTGRPVAIKVLHMIDSQSIERFRTEIEVLGRLDHPGVVRLCGWGSHNGVPYLVLDLVDGPSLADVLANGPLGVERSVSIGEQLAEALAHAHELDIVHRDVKPANVILDTDPTHVRLADFGIARFGDATRMTATGYCVGTAAYLAPEQLEGQAGPATDIYALALVMLECVTGTRCYPGTLAETTAARLHRAPLVPADLPRWLRHTLRAMTARDPRQRPPATAVAEALRHRSVDAVLAPTVEIDVANHQITGSTDTTESRTPKRPRARTARGPLALAFGSGALTTAALLAILALSLAIWPFADNGAQATESPAAPTPTSTAPEP
jgi:serine/threonine protein kinase